MPNKLSKSKNKSTSSQLTSHSAKTTGPALACTYKGGSGTYAENHGRAVAVTHHGSAWSQSVAYGGGDPKHNSYHHVSKRGYYSYTWGNAVAGVVEGGTFALAGRGGYGEAVFWDGDRFSVSVAYGGGGGGWVMW